MQLLAFILIYPFLWLISVLPFRVLYGISDIFFVLVYKVIGYRKKVVYNNLKLGFPNKTHQEIKAISKAFYHHFCDLMMESIKALTITETQLRKRFKIQNVDLILNFEKKNKSIVLMCGHYGNWEWGFILQTFLNSKGYVLYKRLRNKHFDNLVKKTRAKFNTYLVSNKEALRVILKSIQKGETIISAFAADQSPKLNENNYWNKFLNAKVPMFTGAETIAKKNNIPVVFLDVQKVKRGFYVASLKLISDNPKHNEDFKITDAFFKQLESQIHRAPQYYLWTHKRWKHKDKNPENSN